MEASASNSDSRLQDTARGFEKDVEQVARLVTEAVLPLQKQSFECSVNCFDTHRKDLDRIGRCLQECRGRADAFGNAMEKEMHMLQNQITGCQQTCHNKYAMAYSAAEKKEQRDAIHHNMDVCATQCFKDAAPNLEALKKRMLDLATKELGS